VTVLLLRTGATVALFATVPPLAAEHGCKQRSRGTLD